MIIRSVYNTFMHSVTYVLSEKGHRECVLVDCGEYETLLPVLEDLQLTPKVVLLTHGHSDHIAGLVKLLVQYPDVVVFASNTGHEMLKNSRKNLSLFQENPIEIKDYNEIVIEDGAQLDVCNIHVMAVATPGHSLSSMSYIVGNYMFTGDSYIPGIKVFTGFSGANKEQAIESENRLKQFEMEGYKVMPGHHSY